MNKEKNYSYEDTINFIDVCYSCSSQNIVLCNHEDDGRESFCKDCNSEDVGSVPPEEVIWELKI